ncbi:MAG: hypothetical protein NTW75_14560 [Planctomycetales bacterium]|nr:hypothetical protein [Planctomycetales bacterium]
MHPVGNPVIGHGDAGRRGNRYRFKAGRWLDLILVDASNFWKRLAGLNGRPSDFIDPRLGTDFAVPREDDRSRSVDNIPSAS